MAMFHVGLYGRVGYATTVATVLTLAGGLSAQAQTAQPLQSETVIEASADAPLQLSASALHPLQASNAVTSESADTTTTGAALTAQAADAPEEPFDVDTRGISPGRSTRSGPSYIGIGANIGVGDGDTALGETSFAVFSKVGLTSNVSLRPTVLIEDNPTILLPVTLDFIPGVTRVTENVSEEVGLRVSPYIGAGVAISLGDDSGVDFLATGGVDVPINSRITATASVSASLFDNPAVGVLLGAGYNLR
ncbi:MAG: hypothetical protein WBA10_12755 [Elainellaceae cyanobacterium]